MHNWSEVLIAQLCLTLCNPIDFSPPGSSVHRVLQARILEWVAMPFSRWSSRPRNQTWVSHMAGSFFTIWATRKAITEIYTNWRTIPHPPPPTSPWYYCFHVIDYFKYHAVFVIQWLAFVADLEVSFIYSGYWIITNYMICKYFSSSVGCLFTLLMVSFDLW